MPRPRVALLVCALVSIALGLGSRRAGGSLPTFVAEYAGDTLYATLVYFLAAFVVPRSRSLWLFAASFGFSCLVEASQLPSVARVAWLSWLTVCRATKLGRLVLGTTFVWSDFPCYAAGAMLALGVDRLVFFRVARRPSAPASQRPRPPS